MGVTASVSKNTQVDSAASYLDVPRDRLKGLALADEAVTLRAGVLAEVTREAPVVSEKNLFDGELIRGYTLDADFGTEKNLTYGMVTGFIPIKSCSSYNAANNTHLVACSMSGLPELGHPSYSMKDGSTALVFYCGIYTVEEHFTIIRTVSLSEGISHYALMATIYPDPRRPEWWYIPYSLRIALVTPFASNTDLDWYAANNRLQVEPGLMPTEYEPHVSMMPVTSMEYQYHDLGSHKVEAVTPIGDGTTRLSLSTGNAFNQTGR